MEELEKKKKRKAPQRIRILKHLEIENYLLLNEQSKKHLRYVKKISSTETYIHLEERLYQESADQFTVKVADALEEAVKLMEVGFEFHAEVEGHKLFRKRK
jgi:hypothetical protein